MLVLLLGFSQSFHDDEVDVHSQGELLLLQNGCVLLCFDGDEALLLPYLAMVLVLNQLQIPYLILVLLLLVLPDIIRLFELALKFFFHAMMFLPEFVQLRN